eukprot:jgi/Chlat1/1355/Chrsp119S01778
MASGDQVASDQQHPGIGKLVDQCYQPLSAPPLSQTFNSSKLRSLVDGTSPQASWRSDIETQLNQLESNAEIVKLQEQVQQAQHALVDAVNGIVQGVTQQQAATPSNANGLNFDAQSAFELLQSRLQAASSAVQDLTSQLGSKQNAYDLLQDRLQAASTAVQDLSTRLGSGQVEWASVADGLQRVLNGTVRQTLDYVANASREEALVALQTSLGVAAANAQDWAQHLDSAQTTAAVALLFTMTTTSLLLAMNNARRVPAFDDLPLRYNSAQIGAYFSRRRPLVFARLVQVAFMSSKFAFSLALDYARGKLQQNELVRARQLRELITSLGAAAIKVGQGLSIRPDILSVAYLAELQLLQDRVPAFDTKQAYQFLEQSLQRPPSVVFSYISPEPVAAASLGQVYKAVLRDTGETVAVKVQRPNVLESVALDLYIIRILFSWIQRIPRVKSNLVDVMESWAFRFFDELDYVQEAENAMLFAEQMKILENITVPRVFPQYTTRKVLTTAWVDGEKLSESNASDVAPLVTTMLNCYLIQLLETGFLHADPHPGNLLRTQDGKLCVLDFGLMTEVTEDQRYTLVEYIAHLLNSDFDKVPYDLMKLGFIPNDKINPEEAAEVAPILGAVIGQFMRGGGAASIDVDAITRDLSALSDTYTFIIPPWFALILRAFGTLEGLGLRADPTYSITKECYPYLSKRLLTDDNPRIRAALRYFLYKGQERLDVNRVKELAFNFQRFAEASKTLAPTDSSVRTTGPVIDQWSQQALQLLFAREGSYLQDLLLQEAVRATDALSRGALAQSWQVFGTLAAQSPLAVVQSLVARSPPEPGTWPIFLPGIVAGKVPYAQLTEEDQEALRTVQGLWEILQPELQRPRPNPTSGWDARTLSQQLFPLVAGLVPGAGLLGLRFLRLLVERQALRLADDLDRGLQTQELPDTTSPAFRRRVTY